jgi:hypothetical protein
MHDWCRQAALGLLPICICDPTLIINKKQGGTVPLK